MKVLLPIESLDDNTDSRVQNIDNSECACIYDQEKDVTEFVYMDSISEKKGNLSIEMKRKGIDAMICSSIPSLALELFNIIGIQIFQSSGTNIAESISAFKNNSLMPISGSSGIQMDGCASSSCASCSSAC